NSSHSATTYVQLSAMARESVQNVAVLDLLLVYPRNLFHIVYVQCWQIMSVISLHVYLSMFSQR
ncbi:hypothetical protein L9F63_008500, partial [Diploptera punctata]